MIDVEGRYMEERVCLLPEVPGMASFEAGNVTVYVHERIIRCKDCDHRRRTWNGHRPNFTSDYFCSYTGGHEVKPSDFCSHAATVGAGTCKNVGDPTCTMEPDGYYGEEHGIYKCSSCGELWQFDCDGPREHGWTCCPHCRATIDYGEVSESCAYA